MGSSDWRGVERGPDGEILIWGWALFGHILPRIGLFDFPCFRDGEPVEALGDTPAVAGFVRSGFAVEWFGRGLCVAFGPVRPRA